jgi:hypothetical protein
MAISASIFWFHQHAILRAKGLPKLVLFLKCFTALESSG